MASKFDLNKVYTKIYSKKEVIEFIEHAYDKEFIVVMLPRTDENADMLIRSTSKELTHKKETTEENNV